MLLRSMTAAKPGRAEEPQANVESLYARQLETLRQVRRGLADVAAARTRVDIRAQQAAALMRRLQQEAEQALTAGHEDPAREALGHRAVLRRRLTDLALQHDALRDQEDAIARSLGVLQARVDGIRTRKEDLDAARTAAEARNTAAQSLSLTGGDLAELDEVLRRAEQDAAALSAGAAGMEELVASGGPGRSGGNGQDGIDAEFDRLEVDNEIEQELAALQRSLEAPHPPEPQEHP